MMRGVVNANHEAIVEVRVRGPNGIETIVNTIVDSGCSVPLVLPAAIVTFLGLARQLGSSAILADGSVHPFDVCAAEIEWNGNWQPVLASVMGNESLLGMRLMAGHKLGIEVMPGGMVEITPLP